MQFLLPVSNTPQLQQRMYFEASILLICMSWLLKQRCIPSADVYWGLTLYDEKCCSLGLDDSEAANPDPSLTYSGMYYKVGRQVYQ